MIVEFPQRGTVRHAEQGDAELLGVLVDSALFDGKVKVKVRVNARVRVKVRVRVRVRVRVSVGVRVRVLGLGF
jgi:hypothetical protein